jgi:hypothetical protein
MTTPASSTIVQRLWNYCNVLHDERRLVAGWAVDAAVEAGLKRAGRLRQAVLKAAFEGRLV